MIWQVFVLFINFFGRALAILAYFNVFSEKNFEGDHTLLYSIDSCKSDIPISYNISSIWSNTPSSCMAFYYTENCTDDQNVLLVLSGLASHLFPNDPPIKCDDLFCDVVGYCENLADDVFSHARTTILSYSLCSNEYLETIKNGTWVSNVSKTCILLDLM